MNRNHFWKLVLIALVLLWAIFEMYPPGPRDLVDYFKTRAQRGTVDETFNDIVRQATELERERPGRAYLNLREAIGTNSIARYFPKYDIKGQPDPNTYILNRLQREAAGKIKLGIDLAGGTSFLVEIDTNQLARTEITVENGVTNTVTRAAAAEEVEGAISQAVSVLRKRVDRFGVAEPIIQPEGENRILIQLPGLSEAVKEDAMETIQKVAFLEFKLVHEQSDELIRQGTTTLPGYQLLYQSRVLPNGSRETTPFLVKRRAEMEGGIASALVTRDQFGKPEISFRLESEAAERFGRITSENVGRQLAIVLDGELQTAPTIQSAILGGNGQITGTYTEQEAFGLANVLENPLKSRLHIISQNDVDPTLGKDAVQSGIKASIIGLAVVAAFMLVYYLLAGAVANIALVCNIIILIGAMCSIDTTFTLPGIAGIVLTIGMAVDANVLIFERIREERAKGKSLKGALDAGYSRAFGTIFDSHVTTLISSIILWKMGTGPIQGFGVSLTIGVGASLFTALVITRLVFDFLINRNLVTDIKMLHLVRAPKIDFMRWAVPAFVGSWLLILIGNGYGLFVRGSDVLGVEFSGGEKVTLAVNPERKPDIEEIRKIATEISKSEVLPGYQTDLSTGRETLRITVRAFAETGEKPLGFQIFEQLKQRFPDAGFGGEFDKPLSIERVGPIVGAEIQQVAVIASLLALFGILVYVALRYEFSFAVAAVIAILHDVFMTMGIYFLSGRELNATTVAAVLTIMGFSINDTIVIFDRIREDLKLGVRGTFREVVNQALNQTLSRTIITSGTVLLATLSLFIFGGGPINDFAFTFLVGILSGTFSTIYIASAIVLWWHKGHRPKIGNTQLTVENAAPART